MKTFQYKIFIALASVLVLTVIIGAFTLWPGETEHAANQTPAATLPQGPQETEQPPDMAALPVIGAMPPELAGGYNELMGEPSWQDGRTARQLYPDIYSDKDKAVAEHPRLAAAKAAAEKQRTSRNHRYLDPQQQKAMFQQALADMERTGEPVNPSTALSGELSQGHENRTRPDFEQRLAQQRKGEHRSPLPEGTEPKFTEEQIEQMHQQISEHILEQYKDNPELAEQMRRLIAERVEQYRQARRSAPPANPEPPSEPSE